MNFKLKAIVAGVALGFSMSGMAAEPIKIGMLWLDAHPDFNTPETTRSGSLGGMPVAVATGRALWRLRLDAHRQATLAIELFRTALNEIGPQ